MLKKINRLSKFKNLENLKSASSQYFILKYNRQESEIAHFGFIVSKKIDKRAVIRNKVKRKLQQAIKDNLDTVLPYTFLIIAKKDSIDEKQEKITKSMSEILVKEKLIK